MRPWYWNGLKSMTEQDFKTTYIKSFLASYKSIVEMRPWFGQSPSQKELLETAEKRATIAWQEYLKENPNDGQI